MKRGGYLKRKKRLNPVSPRKVAYQDELQAMAPLVDARSRLLCEVRADGCTVRAKHMHHRLRRSQGGTNDLSNLLAVCWNCHRRIHMEPNWAYDHGYLLRRT